MKTGAAIFAALVFFSNTSGRFFDIMRNCMGSLCLQTTLWERGNHAGDGMGVSSFYFKEVA